MSSTATPAPRTKPLLDSVFGDLWRDPRAPGRPGLVGVAVAVGLLAAIIVPWRTPGLGTFLVMAAMLGVVAAADRLRRTAEQVGSALLCLALVSPVMLRDAAWIVVLCLLAAFAVGSVALCRGRFVPGLVASTLAVPLAGVRGLPWLARSLGAGHRPASMWPLLRTVLLSVALLVVFGTLFASADAIFAGWVQALLPDMSLDGLAVRVVVLVVVTGSTLAGVFVALAPPAVGRLTLPAAATVRRFEWRFRWVS